MNALMDLEEVAHEHLLMHFTRNGAFGPGRQPVLVLERGEGPYVFDTHGNRYFDALSALFCSQLGYSYGEELAAAAAAQMAKLPFSTIWSMSHPTAVELSERLAELAPPGLGHVFFTGGGAESVESAWKLARLYHNATGGEQRTKAIARRVAYHGATLGALALTGVDSYKAPFGAAGHRRAPRQPDQPLPAGRGRALRRGRARRRGVLPPAARGDRGGRARGGTRDDRDVHRGAGAERRRLLRPARPATGRGSASSPTATASWSWPTR